MTETIPASLGRLRPVGRARLGLGLPAYLGLELWLLGRVVEDEGVQEVTTCHESRAFLFGTLLAYLKIQ